MARSKATLPSFLEEDCLDENVSVTALERPPKTWDSQIYKRHDVLSLSPKSGRVQYGESQKGGKNRKDNVMLWLWGL